MGRNDVNRWDMLFVSFKERYRTGDAKSERDPDGIVKYDISA